VPNLLIHNLLVVAGSGQTPSLKYCWIITRPPHPLQPGLWEWFPPPLSLFHACSPYLFHFWKTFVFCRLSLFLAEVNFLYSRKEKFMPRTIEKSAPAPKKPHTAKGNPSTDEIALRAYHIFLERGATPGNELEDWVRAERELIANSSRMPRKSKSKTATI
jgi:hypothetical protein